jgi:kynurenine formamidase
VQQARPGSLEILVKDRQSGALIVAAWPSRSARKLDFAYLARTGRVRKGGAAASGTPPARVDSGLRRYAKYRTLVCDGSERRFCTIIKPAGRPSMRIIDLSVALKAGIASDPPYMLPSIEYVDHREGAKQFTQVFPGLKVEQLPDGEGPAVERVTISTHNGTHLDAPWHFASTMDGGKPSLKIDQVPLEWFLSAGVKLDFRTKPDGYVCKADDVKRELDRIGHALKPLDIVLINTAAGAAYGDPSFLNRGCGMGREATLYLLKQGVRVAGTDAWSWDAPFSFTAKRFAETGDPSIIWEGHKASREIGYCHMEKLANLDQLPPLGFKVCCFPVKIEAASAGWTRCVALLDG